MCIKSLSVTEANAHFFKKKFQKNPNFNIHNILHQKFATASHP